MDSTKYECSRGVHVFAKDAEGNEHLVGLTQEDSAFYIWFSNEPVCGDFPSMRDIDRFMSISQKHVQALLALAAKERES